MAFRPSRRNAYLVLCNDTRVRGKIWHDDFKGALMRSQEEYKDTDDTKLQMWLEGIYGMRMSTGTVSEVARLVGEEFARNPLHEYLESCQWDGVPRIDQWLIRGAGALDSPLVRAVGKRWLISAVARAMQPGCKDCIKIWHLYSNSSRFNRYTVCGATALWIKLAYCSPCSSGSVAT